MWWLRFHEYIRKVFEKHNSFVFHRSGWHNGDWWATKALSILLISTRWENLLIRSHIPQWSKYSLISGLLQIFRGTEKIRALQRIGARENFISLKRDSDVRIPHFLLGPSSSMATAHTLDLMPLARGIFSSLEKNVFVHNVNPRVKRLRSSYASMKIGDDDQKSHRGVLHRALHVTSLRNDFANISDLSRIPFNTSSSPHSHNT
jgi:hypothetical protein